jgi:hypothetical protein
LWRYKLVEFDPCPLWNFISLLELWNRVAAMYNNSLPNFFFFAEVNGFLLGWLILNVIGWEMVSQYHGDQGLACWNSVCKYSVCGCASISLYFVSACVFEFDVFMFTFVTSFCAFAMHVKDLPFLLIGRNALIGF